MWLALDNDGSGRLTAGEFGAFMRLGERERSTGPSEKAAQWRERVQSANRRVSQQMRAERDKLLDRDITTSGLPKASVAEVRELALLLHDKMHQLFSVVNNGVPTKVSWFRLFKHMDDDESGLISYTEFEGMVREELLLGPRQVPDKHLKAVWLCAAPLLATAGRLGRSNGAPCTDSWFPDVARRALDNDGSGRLTAGEFGAFMRLGERERSNDVSEKGAQWRERVQSANRRASQQARAERDKLLDRSLGASMASEPPATDEEVSSLTAYLCPAPTRESHDPASAAHRHRRGHRQ